MIKLTNLDPTKRLPWCAAFAAYVGYAALRKQWPLRKVAGCVSLFDDALAKGMIRTTPAPGAVFLLWSDAKGRFAHTGFVVGEAVGVGSWETLEGNTNEAGHREGIGTFARTRRWGPKDRFIHWWETTPTGD